MILRIFFSLAAFLVAAVLISKNPLLESKRDASQNKSQQSQQTSFTSSNELQKRMMELGAVQSEAQQKRPSIIMNDPHILKKWGLEKSNALDAWQLTTGSREIVVAVVDTGIDITHPDIKNNLWRNPGESGKDKNGRNKATNGIDDDGNGYIDEVHG
ncbi:MAG: serine protease/subtilase, partial [Bdellovibrionales bacterium]|nr:S8 family serine peptidase [Bdellovibrionales bacterium]NQZ18605.1 serine protease/subtilase [Bdellovibrionales bacterium]